jgi:hypothetical protein
MLSPASHPLELLTAARSARTFWGSCDEAIAEMHAKQLFATLQSLNILPAAAELPPHLLARYNPPFTVWFMKKNEVLIDLTSCGAQM